MKVKIFKETSESELEVAINNWLHENTDIKVVGMYYHSCILYDLYHSDPTRIANQWQECTMTILYEENKGVPSELAEVEKEILNDLL